MTQDKLTSAISVALTPSELALWLSVNRLEQLGREVIRADLGDDLYDYVVGVRRRLEQELIGEARQVGADIVYIVRPDPARPGQFERVATIPVPKA